MTPEITTLLKLETVAETDGAKKFDDRLKQNQRTIKSVTKDLQIQELMLRKKSRSYQFVKAHVAGATKEELKAILASEKNIERLKQKDAQMAKNNKTLRMMRGGFGQVGHQVQDVAVQLQTGTDAMIVFGQQGSQIVSLFGPGGAMLGAVLAVGAALVTSFKPAVDESASAVKEFVEDISKQRKELGLLTAAEKELDAIRRASTIRQITENTSELQGNLEHLTQTHARYKKMLEGVKLGDEDALIAAQLLGLSYADLEEKTRELSDRLGLSKGTIAANNAAIDEGTEAALKAAEADKKRIENINELIRAAAEEAHTTGMSAREQALYKAQVQGANKAQLDAIEHLYDLIDAKQAEKKATENAEKAERKRQDTVNGLIKTAATQASTTGMTKRELAIYNATLQGATTQEIATLNALHDVIDARIKAQKAIRDQKAAIEELRDATIQSMFTREQEAVALVNQYRDQETVVREAAQKKLDILQEFNDLGVIQDEAYAATKLAIEKELAEKVAQIRGEKPATDSPDDFSKRFTELEQSFMTELELIRAQEQEKLDLVAEFEAKSVENKEKAAALRQKIAEDTAQKEQAAMMMATSTVLGLMDTQIGQLAGMFDKASGLGKAFFVAQQAIAAANAIISGEAAAAKALEVYASLPDFGISANAMANMFRISGYASAAAIMGQTVASFEGGGMTFNGVRSGGMDGRGGRLAIVHPNEKITDMEKAPPSEQPVNVNINIQAVDAKGIDELLVKRRGVITSLVRNSLNNTGARLG
jgi:hypothetical protein